MTTIKYNNGAIKTVRQSEAHRLIELGLAKLYVPEKEKESKSKKKNKKNYKTKEMLAK